MAKAIFKWAGGKRRLLPDILSILPKTIDTYYEPMVGGGAVFFKLASTARFKRAVLCDINKELMNAYTVIRNNLEDMLPQLQKLEKKYFYAKERKEYYYKVREHEPENHIQSAARFIFLNKTCFNGLYRVNKAGTFNVPFGKHAQNITICDVDRLQRASKILQKAELVCADFVDVLELMTPKDAAYIDPPYLKCAKTSFTNYTQDGFSYNDHVRLAKVVQKLAKKKIRLVISNADVPETWELYAGLNISKVQAPRSINSDGTGRGKVSELLISTGVWT